MADPRQKWPENTPGPFFVDQNCIATKYCISAAPNNFAMSEDGHAYLRKQPATSEEEGQCREAIRGCPVNAIGEVGP
jgi:ferredoxin